MRAKKFCLLSGCHQLISEWLVYEYYPFSIRFLFTGGQSASVAKMKK